jgi:hypothetical protein
VTSRLAVSLLMYKIKLYCQFHILD